MGNAFWKSPTPHEISLRDVDAFLATNRWTAAELDAVWRYYGSSKRRWALRHLRLNAAVAAIRAMR